MTSQSTSDSWTIATLGDIARRREDKPTLQLHGIQRRWMSTWRRTDDAVGRVRREPGRHQQPNAQQRPNWLAPAVTRSNNHSASNGNSDGPSAGCGPRGNVRQPPWARHGEVSVRSAFASSLNAGGPRPLERRQEQPRGVVREEAFLCANLSLLLLQYGSRRR